MTALKKYQRLEATGLWRDAPGARLREVVVGLREATLILTDPRTEMPLAQWSLPAVRRCNPGKQPAVFSPGEDDSEELELDEPEMIAALDTVRRALEKRRPHPGRLRGLVLGLTAVAVVGVVVFWLPGQVKSHVAGVLPKPTRLALGEMALADLSRLTGSPCKGVAGRRSATALAERLFPGTDTRIEILREALSGPAHLPGNILLLPASLVEAADGPEEIAGHLITEALLAKTKDPMDPVLSHIGLGATLRLMTTGTIPPSEFKGYGETLLAAEDAPFPDATAMIEAFRIAETGSAFQGEALGKTDLGTYLIDNDPYPLGTPKPLLSDETWLELQAICAD